MNDEQVLLNKPKFELKCAFGACLYITRISDNSITIEPFKKPSIDVLLYHNDEGYYFFLEREYFHEREIAFSIKDSNIYGLLLKKVNFWIVSDFPLCPASGIEPYLDLYYKRNSVIKSNPEEVLQVEIVESAEQVHNRICDNFDKVEKTLYDICVDLKKVKDNKYYKTLGYDTFESYCQSEFNITRRTGSKYLSISNLPFDFGKSTSHFGTEKLYILSRLTDEERTELIENTDIENTPVKEVEKKAKEIKENKTISDSEISATALVSTSKENQFIDRYGKKMNALLIYLRDDFRKVANSLKYENFVDKYPMDLVSIESLYNDVKALECFLFSVREICSNSNSEHLQEHSANEIKAILLGEKKSND